MKNSVKYLSVSLEEALKIVSFEELINPGTSAMSDVILKITWSAEKPYNHKRIAVRLALLNDEVVGWGWMVRRKKAMWSKKEEAYKDCIYYGFMAFVRKEFRNRRIGTELFKWGRDFSRRKHNKMIVYPWDARSSGFFNSLAVKESNTLEYF